MLTSFIYSLIVSYEQTGSELTAHLLLARFADPAEMIFLCKLLFRTRAESIFIFMTYSDIILRILWPQTRPIVISSFFARLQTPPAL